MLARWFILVGLCCLTLCACKPKPSQHSKCNADAGCADASVCADGAVCETEHAREQSGGQDEAAAGSGKRVSAARAAKDAGAAEQDAATAMRSEPKPAQKPRAQAGSEGGGKAGSGGSARPEKMQTPAQAGTGGASEPSADCDEACEKACEQRCGPCQACAADHKTCQPVTGADDADSCSDSHTCSSRGMCLNVSEAQKNRGDSLVWSELTTTYAQVISFSQPASIQEIQLEVACRENDQTFPAVWIVAAPGGAPSTTTIATANVIYQAPTEHNSFALLELSKVLEQPETGPIAIVVGKTDMECILRVNAEQPYPNGELFMQGSLDLWAPTQGSMVFQVLSSK